MADCITYVGLDVHRESIVVAVAAAAGVAGLPFLEAGVQRRPARAHLIIARAVRHTPPPLRLGACIYSRCIC